MIQRLAGLITAFDSGLRGKFFTNSKGIVDIMTIRPVPLPFVLINRVVDDALLREVHGHHFAL